MDKNDVTPFDPIRQVAEINLNAVLEAKSHLMDEHSAAFRWILATLVTVNGGGALSVVSADKITHFGKITGGGLFCLGVLFAVFLAYCTVLSVQKLLQPTIALIDFWVITLISGEFDESDISKRQKVLKTSARPWTIASHSFGLISTACFVAGVLQIGANLT